MRKMAKYSSILFILLGTVSSLWAGTRLSPDESQYLAVWGAVGGKTLLNNSKEVKPGLGVEPSLGVGYQYIRNGFMVQIGLEGSFSYLNNSLDNMDFRIKMKDTEGDPFVMHASVADCKDVVRTADVRIPILVGYEYNRFYFLAGAKVGVSLWGTTQTKSQLSTKGEYDRFIDWFENVPNHDFANNQTIKSSAYKLKFKAPSVDLHIEVGGRLDKIFPIHERTNDLRHDYRLYLAIFADYGVLNIHENVSEGDLLTYTVKDGESLRFTAIPAMVSEQMMNKKVNPLTIGIKFTFLWNLPMKQECVRCMD